MLKLSNRGLYGVKALYELAVRYGDTPITIREISERHGLPVAFLEQVLHILKKEELVESHRGANGGYSLARDPGDITIGDVIRALEGPIALCDCLRNTSDEDVAEKERRCVTSHLYRKLSKKVEESFDSVTLKELMSESVNDPFTGTCL